MRGIPLWFAISVGGPCALAAGGIVTDGTLGPAQRLNGAQVTIPQILGQTVGANLFHSFSAFNVETGQTAIFTGSDHLNNVIARVTGGDASIIDGLLRSTAGQADFYLINPAGVTFGPNARIDVPAAFHVGTADRIELADGAVFAATDPATGSQLGGASPAAFGFLGTSAANNGLIEADGAQLSVRAGHTLDFAAGDLRIANGALLAAPAGDIRLTAMRGAGEASLTRLPNGLLPLPATPPSTNDAGGVALQRSRIETTGNGGGSIGLWGGAIAIFGENAGIVADNDGDAAPTQNAGIAIAAVTLDIENGLIASDSRGSGRGRDLSLEIGENFSLRSDSRVSTWAFGAGDAGNIGIRAGNLTIDGRSSDGLFSEAGSRIVSLSPAESKGDAGTIAVNVAGDISLLGGGRIASLTRGSGSSGDVTVAAGRDIRIDGLGAGSLEMFTGIGSQTSSQEKGNAANLSIEAGRHIALFDGGEISSLNLGLGQGGSIDLRAGDTLVIDGYPTNSLFSAFTAIASQANSGSAGNAGNIRITVERDIAIRAGGEISASAFEFSTGRAGNVEIASGGDIRIDGQRSGQFTGVASQANPNSSGDAGNVTVKARGTIEMVRASQISSSTFAAGAAGSVNVKTGELRLSDSAIAAAAYGPDSSGVTGNVEIAAARGVHLTDGSGVSIENEAVGQPSENVAPGRIRIVAQTATLARSEITTRSSGDRDAGSIELDFAQSLDLSDGSFVRTLAQSGNGGDIATRAGATLSLTQSGIETSVLSGSGNGGDIAVATGLLTMQTGLIQANASGGFGGNIAIAANILLASGDTLGIGGTRPIAWNPDNFGFNLIQAASRARASGTLSAAAPQLNLSGVLANFGAPAFDIGAIDRNSCAASESSLLARSGKGGLPQRNAPRGPNKRPPR